MRKYKEARDMGRNARYAKRPRESNPYNSKTAEARRWRDNWFAGWDVADDMEREKNQ